MRITVNPITVHTESGDVVCTLAEASIAVSNSTAVRLVPVDDAGIEYPNDATGIVGTNAESDIATFMQAVSDAVTALALGRGI